MKRMANTLHAVMALDADGRVLDKAFNVHLDQVPKKVEEFRTKHPGAKVEVDGRDAANAAIIARTTPTTIAETPEPGEYSGVELAHHLLWESYSRAAKMQAYCAEQAHAQQVKMTEDYAKQMQTLRDQHTAAMGKIDAIEWEKKVFEQERAFQHLTLHHRALAEDDRRAQERRDDDSGNLIKQVVGGVISVIQALGGDSINSGASATRTGEAPK